MAKTVALKVVTRDGVALEDEVTSVVAPGEIGYLGVLHNHAPLVTTLRAGKLSWQAADGRRKTVMIGAGLLEISRNRLTVLTDTVSAPASAPSR